VAIYVFCSHSCCLLLTAQNMSFFSLVLTLTAALTLTLLVHWLDVPERIHYKPQTGSHSASLSAVQGSGVPDRLLYTSLRHFRSSSLLYCRSDGLELATGQSLRPGTHQQQFQTIAEDEYLFRRYHSAHTTL